MRKSFLRAGSIFAGAAVILGAFGAHTLEEFLTVEQLETFDTGVRYHFYHSFAILLVALLLHYGKKSRLSIAGWLFSLGIVLFSGSLYLLAIQEALGISLSWLGPITPLGGTLFILGWGFLLASTYQENERKKTN